MQISLSGEKVVPDDSSFPGIIDPLSNVLGWSKSSFGFFP